MLVGEELGYNVQCTKPFLVRDPKTGYPIEVPCGNCRSCRKQRSREWTNRLLHEMEYHTDNSFVTLTYASENLPDNYTLVKSDLQKYFKRVRKEIGTKKIKYYACGEYGDKYDRPHYHIIFLGLGQKTHEDIITDNWKLGRIHIGSVTTESIAYVTSYVQKKLNGDLGKEVYTDTGRIAPFSLLSKGIGLQFVKDNAEQLTENLGFTVSGRPAGLPRYYRNKLNLKAEDLVSQDAINNKHEMFDKIASRGNTDLTMISEAIRKSREYTEKKQDAKSKLFEKGIM